MRPAHISFLIYGGILSLVISLGIMSSGNAQTEVPEPEMPPLPSGLDPPPTVYPPTQISEGSYTYYLVCMACHGDRGQGLTDEWRGALDLEDQNCWQSRCHASNHPPDGFVFPKIAPALASPAMLARFETALDLYQYLKTGMPFQAPGSLSDQEYWQLTAFLISLNGIDLENLPLTPLNADQIKLRVRVVGSPEETQSASGLSWAGIGIGGILLVLLSVLAFKRRSRER